ncbi:MAG TPA: hypothetical protein VGR84_11965 [Candidatus Acidoferrales bacterium]|nr:hypothetical protein [Candidatus Acidoferrales bacterium]
MTFSSTRRFCGGALVVVALVYLSSCAVPLAPGYQIEKQSITVRFVPGNPPHLAIRAQYRLANVGTTPLDSIELGLPGEQGFGLANLRVKIDGHEVVPQREPGQTSAPAEGETAVSEMWADTWRVPFASHWSRRQRKNLVLEYDLAAHSTTDPRISVGSNAFYLNDSGWFPDPISAKALFAKDVVRPDPSDLFVDVPANFVATASGEPRGTRKARGETGFRFRLRKDDFDPYVVAGQYTKQFVSSASVIFWSAEPLSSNLQQPAAALVQTFQFYLRFLGPLPRDNTTIYVINTDTAPMQRDFLAAFEDVPPSTIVTGQSLNNAAFAAEFPTHAAEESLAATWFTHLVKPRPESWPLASGLEAYAADLVDQQRANSTSRAAEISSRLLQFTKMNEMAVESPVESLTPDAAPAQVHLSEIKIVLFLFALEDKCGRENLEHAIAHMVYALRGQEYGYTDFRAALEQECHQDLSSTFATWLDQKGIPADFRARYENATSK